MPVSGITARKNAWSVSWQPFGSISITPARTGSFIRSLGTMDGWKWATRFKRDLMELNFQSYAAYLRGELNRPATRLVDCRPFVHLNDLAYIASSKISTVPAASIVTYPEGYLEIRSISEVIHEFVQNGQFPSDQSISWAVRGGESTPAELPTLNQVIKENCIQNRPAFPNNSYRGYRRHDFLIGENAIIAIEPNNPVPGQRWVWRAESAEKL